MITRTSTHITGLPGSQICLDEYKSIWFPDDRSFHGGVGVVGEYEIGN